MPMLRIRTSWWVLRCCALTAGYSEAVTSKMRLSHPAYVPRTAFAKAVSEGYGDFTAIAIVGGPADQKETDFCTPCGVCRQVMKEFCQQDFHIVCAKTDETGNIVEQKVFTMAELLPESFSL